MSKKYITENYFFMQTTQLINTEMQAYTLCIKNFFERHFVLEDSCVLSFLIALTELLNEKF